MGVFALERRGIFHWKSFLFNAPNPAAATHLELPSKSKRRNSSMPSPCPPGFQKASLRKAPRELPLAQPRCSTRWAGGTACKSHHHNFCSFPACSAYIFKDFYGLPLAVQEPASLISLALAAVSSWCDFSVSLSVAGFMQQGECFHFIPKFTLPMEQLGQNLLNFYI